MINMSAVVRRDDPCQSEEGLRRRGDQAKSMTAIDGFSLTFMKIDRKRLDPSDKSVRLGRRQAEPRNECQPERFARYRHHWPFQRRGLHCDRLISPAKAGE